MPFEVEINDKVAELVFAHPPVNAFTGAMWLELPEIITSLGQRPELRCILIRAKGKGFCAGVDIKELAENSNAIVEVNKGNYLTYKAIHDCEIPVVSAPHGFVLGGGIGVCGSSDAVIAASSAYFALPEIERGARGGASHMQRMFPHARVRAAFLTGGQITAEQAFQLGGIEQVFEEDRHLEAAREFAGLIASKSRDALRIAKEALNGIEAFDVDKSYRWEQGFTYEMYMHEDSQSARDAFVETGSAAKFEDD